MNKNYDNLEVYVVLEDTDLSSQKSKVVKVCSSYNKALSYMSSNNDKDIFKKHRIEGPFKIDSGDMFPFVIPKPSYDPVFPSIPPELPPMERPSFFPRDPNPRLPKIPKLPQGPPQNPFNDSYKDFF